VSAIGDWNFERNRVAIQIIEGASIQICFSATVAAAREVPTERVISLRNIEFDTNSIVVLSAVGTSSF
jgi:hypothetical protein